MVIIKNFKPPATEEEILTLEREINCPLPLDYRNFLKEYNGGIPVPGYFYYKDPLTGEELALLEEFYYVGSDNDDFSCIVYHLRKFRGVIPEDMLPIGKTASGNIYIVMHGKNIGQIVIQIQWIHPDEGNLFFVSKDFSTFLDSLHAI